jgi:hypothetical protein
MAFPNAIDLLSGNGRRRVQIYAFIQTEVEETIPVDLACPRDNVGGIIPRLRQAPPNGRRTHLDALVDVCTRLRPYKRRAENNRRYKHEDANRVVQLLHACPSRVTVRMPSRIIRAVEKRGFSNFNRTCRKPDSSGSGESLTEFDILL